MAELRSEDLEELVQELEEEDSTQESLPQEVEELLHVLQSGTLYSARGDAAEQLGKVGTSSPRIVRALIAAYESDFSSTVNRAAAKSLRAPVHQEYLQQHPDLMEATEGALQQRPGADRQLPRPDRSMGRVAKTLSPTETYAKMRREIQLWGLWAVLFGVLDLVFFGLSSPSGVMLVLAGLASFVFRESPMFLVYGVVICWAAISNLLSGQVQWIIFAVQLVVVYVVLRKYTRFRRAEAALDSPPGPQRASRAFPQIGCALGALALLGLVIIFVGVIFLSAFGSTDTPPVLVWLEGLVVGLAVLGLAVAMASLLSGYRHKPMAVLGTVASSLVLLLQIAFLLAQLLSTGAQTEAPTAAAPSPVPTLVPLTIPVATFPPAVPTPAPPVAEAMRQLEPGWTSYLTGTEVTDNLSPGGTLVGSPWSGIGVAADGALWFTTLGAGVFRFDGATWTRYSEEDGLASSVVLSVTEGRGPLGGTGGMLWFATAEGICRFDGETWTSYPESAYLAGGPGVTALAPDGALWYGTAKGATRFDGESWTTYTTADGLARDYILDIVVGSDGALWFATNGGVSRFDPLTEGKAWTSFTTTDGLARNRVASVALALDGALWFGTEGGVSRFDGETWATYKTADGLVNNAVNAVAVAPDGALWFGTEGGVSRFDPLTEGEAWTTYTTADGLVNNAVDLIGVAPDGALWFATGGGISRYMPQEASGAGEVASVLSPTAYAAATPVEEGNKLAVEHFRRGVDYQEQGQLGLAIEEFTQAIEFESGFIEAYLLRGMTYIALGDLDKGIADLDRALPDLDRAVEQDPRLAEAYFNRGVAHFFKFDYDKAVADFDRAIELNPRYVEAYAVRGNAYDNNGEFDKALASYGEALALDLEKGQHALLLFDRGQAYARHGDKDLAAADLEKALELGLPPVVAQEAEAILDALRN
jgi:Tfp pilus assembly protein PilF/sugar lactone lactonase YvrE